MDTTVFYAWQSDRPQKQHRYFLEKKLRKVLKELNRAAVLDVAVRLEHDTKNISGTPEIAGTIFDKIRNCQVFVGDVTFVGKSDSSDDEWDLLPNPNVLLELGYAANVLGWDRIVLVMNDAYGTGDKLPFDLRNRRWPISYDWPDGASKPSSTKYFSFVETLRFAVLQALEAEHAAVENAIGALDEGCLTVIKKSGGNRFSVEKRHRISTLPTVRTLIALNIVRCNSIPVNDEYEYEWTPLGRLVLKKLGIVAMHQRTASQPIHITTRTDTTEWQ